MENFIFCIANCGYGQWHDGGREQPIITCSQCGTRACFQHQVRWHESLTCEEYDALLADPEHFRSRFELDNEEAEAAAKANCRQVDADRVFAQGLMAEEQRGFNDAKRERERRERETREARERAKKEQAREARERAEREEKKKMGEMRRMAAQRKREEDMSQDTVKKTTKPCPGCGSAIEKKDGW